MLLLVSRPANKSASQPAAMQPHVIAHGSVHDPRCAQVPRLRPAIKPALHPGYSNQAGVAFAMRIMHVSANYLQIIEFVFCRYTYPVIPSECK